MTLLFVLFSSGLTQNRVVGYYPEWVMSSMGVDELDFSILSHVNQSFAWPSASGEIQSYAGMLDVDVNVTIHENGGYISLCFGGWGNSAGFAPMTADPVSRANFISNVIETCQYYEYDGVDFDWEHPANSTETDNYTLLIEELRAATDEIFDNFLITMAIPAGNWSGQHYDLTALEPLVDWFNVMTYDYHGTWTTHAGHNSPLYSSPANDPDGSCHTSINYILNSRHLDPAKVNLGLAFYGKEFAASAINGASTGGNITYQYNDLIGFLDQGWSYHWDDVANNPYLQNPDMTRLITYDDPNSIALKCEYARTRELGGVLIWALGQDFVAGEEVLLEAVRDYATPIEVPLLIPEDVQLLSNYPNPFNPITTIRYGLPEAAQVTLFIYDIKGRKVRSLIGEQQAAGSYEYQWNGMDDSGQPVSTGLYLTRLQAGSYTKTIKMLYLK